MKVNYVPLRWLHTSNIFRQKSWSHRNLSIVPAELKSASVAQWQVPDDYQEDQSNQPYIHTETSYYLDSNGFRRVYPFYYNFLGAAPSTWSGKTAYEVLQKHFRKPPYIHLRQRFANGSIRINGNRVSPDHIIRTSDFITVTTHKHEPPVLGAPIKIIHDDRDVVVVDKPPSIPCHPTGRYFYNTMISILEHESGLWPEDGLRLCHRLDRLTSGILILAKTSQKACEIHTEISNRNVVKEYVCRVEGEFPDGEVICNAPLHVISHRLCMVIADPQGKPSNTVFKKLNYNGRSSTVICRPYTGRTHQIRVHLQYLGHPIINDPLYTMTAFGPNRGKGGDYGGLSRRRLRETIFSQFPNHVLGGENLSDDETVLDAASSEKISTLSTEDDEAKSTIYHSLISPLRDKLSPEKALAALGHYHQSQEWEDLKSKYQFDSRKVFSDPRCRDCYKSFMKRHPCDFLLYLHAYRYKGNGWEYKTDMPVWARDDWEDY